VRNIYLTVAQKYVTTKVLQKTNISFQPRRVVLVVLPHQFILGTNMVVLPPIIYVGI